METAEKNQKLAEATIGKLNEQLQRLRRCCEISSAAGFAKR
jgi:hypothetical protein